MFVFGQYSFPFKDLTVVLFYFVYVKGVKYICWNCRRALVWWISPGVSKIQEYAPDSAHVLQASHHTVVSALCSHQPLHFINMNFSRCKSTWRAHQCANATTWSPSISGLHTKRVLHPLLHKFRVQNCRLQKNKWSSYSICIKNNFVTNSARRTFIIDVKVNALI